MSTSSTPLPESSRATDLSSVLPVESLDALPAGTRLGEYELLSVLGVGGFGIVYLALDHALERQVAIKEYMPASLAARGGGSQLSLRSASHAETFAAGLRSFINEARLLARFDHPSLIKVYRFWEGNGTAYMVMPYVTGDTLQATRRAMPRPPGGEWLASVALPLLGSLEIMHAEAVYHRDISPDNILLVDDPDAPAGLQSAGRPVLLDFGAARHVIEGQTQHLTAILKPAFAPIEQYAEASLLQQGPWTDFYALGAVLYYCMAGAPPTAAAARAVHDELLPARELGHRLMTEHSGLYYSDAFLDAIDWALAVRPAGRPQEARQLRDALLGQRPATILPGEPVLARTQPPPLPKTVPSGRTAPIGPGHEFAPTEPRRKNAGNAGAAVPALADSGERRRRVPWGIAMAASLASMAGVVWWAQAKGEGESVSAASPPVPMAASAIKVQPLPAAVAKTHEASAAVTGAPVPTPVLASNASPPVPPSSRPEPVPTPTPKPVQAQTQAQPVLPPPVENRRLPKPLETPASAAVTAAAPRRGLGDVPERSPERAASAPMPRQEPAEHRSETHGVSSPREACGKRVLLAMWSCIREQCEKNPRFVQHPECVRQREQQDRNQSPGGS